MSAARFLFLHAIFELSTCLGQPILDVPRGWTPDWRAEQIVLGESDDCIVSHVTRYSMARGRSPVSFSTTPLRDFELPRIEPMNATAGEQWEFDGTSSDGTQACIFGFYRDPNYSILGTGNLRVYADFALSNESRYSVVEYAEESTIVSCPGRGTTGTWRGKGFEYSFQISADMTRAKVVMNNPDAKATIAMTSVAPPRYADGSTWPSPNASSQVVPHFYWAQPVPAAAMVMEAVIQGRKVEWHGMGGHERLWGAFNWPTCLSSLLVVRLHAGPYVLTNLEFGSGRVKGLQVPSLVLTEDGERIFATKQTEPSDTEDYMHVRKIYGGEGITTEHLSDKATGFEITLESPSRHRRWSFVITHRIVGFEYVLPRGMGGTGYAGTAIGGLEGSKQWEGPAFTEIMNLPEKLWFLPTNYIE